MLRLRLVVGVIAIGTCASRLRAQCPDGSPPPCGRATVHPAANSVAVLYFDNLSGDTADAYLAEGLTEEIIVRLGQIRRIDVKSRYEVQRFRGRPHGDLASLGSQLHAAVIVTGSLQKAGSRVRVRVELVRAATRTRIWGDVIDRSSDDVLSIEQEIATAVVHGVAGQLLPEERTLLARRPTQNTEAYDLYLRGRALMANSAWGPSLHRAIELFEGAFTLDSGFAEAEASVAEAWLWTGGNFDPDTVAYPRARSAAQRAIRADSGNARAWAVLASSALGYGWAPTRAESLARRAIALDPRMAFAHQIRGKALLVLGSVAEGVAELQRAYDLDSLSDLTVLDVTSVITQARHYDEASALIRRYQQAASSSLVGQFIELNLYVFQGDCTRALPLIARIPSVGTIDSTRTLYLSLIELHCRGEDDLARRVFARHVAAWQAAKLYFSAQVVAIFYLTLGSRDEALAWLARAFDDHDVDPMITYSVVWDGVRDDARFKALLGRLVPQLEGR